MFVDGYHYLCHFLDFYECLQVMLEYLTLAWQSTFQRGSPCVEEWEEYVRMFQEILFHGEISLFCVELVKGVSMMKHLLENPGVQCNDSFVTTKCYTM